MAVGRKRIECPSPLVDSCEAMGAIFSGLFILVVAWLNFDLGGIASGGLSSVRRSLVGFSPCVDFGILRRDLVDSGAKSFELVTLRFFRATGGPGNLVPVWVLEINNVRSPVLLKIHQTNVTHPLHTVQYGDEEDVIFVHTYVATTRFSFLHASVRLLRIRHGRGRIVFC